MANERRAARLAAGLCVDCGADRGLSKRLCDACLEIQRERMRHKRGNKPWQKGSPGSVPLTERTNAN